MNNKPKHQPIRSKPLDNKQSTIAEKAKRTDYYLIALGIVIICIAFIRFRLINIPLERDEGEYAYLGKLILDGIVPYKEAYSMKLPGTYCMYALIMELFGKNISGIHLGLLLINVSTIVFFYLGFKKIFTSSIALFTACAYGLMSLSWTAIGSAAHATQFVTFFVSVGIYFLTRFYENKKLRYVFLVGLMFGLSFLMKQQAVFFIVFGGLAVLLDPARPDRFLKPVRSKGALKLKSILSEGAIYSSGAILPYVITVVILTIAGAFDNFWYWTVKYAGNYVSEVSYESGKRLFAFSFNPMWGEFKFFWIIFIAGIALIWLTKFSLRQKLFAILFTIFAFLTVCPGFYFRQHYFVPFLPAIGLLGAVTLDYAGSLLSRQLKNRSLAFFPFIVFCIVSILIIAKNKVYYLEAKPNEISRMVYGSNPFVESPVIANYIKANSSPSDKIAVLGSEPQIFFYADRNSATGFIYTYGLMGINDYNKMMQQQMISEIEKAKPKFLIYCNISTSWGVKAGSPTLIFDWYKKYSSDNYEIVGIADIVPKSQTIYKWNSDAKTYRPMGINNVLVYKRK
jgi:4-amino-4-deoxy-L-arabinose transferase-like glycosyltransferase